MRKIKILSRHSSLTAAVAAAGLDLSYNEPAAREKIALLETPPARWARQQKPVTEAYVVEMPDSVRPVVLYRFSCDLSLLNKFDPFISTLSDAPFKAVCINADEIQIFDELKLAKANRAAQTAVGLKKRNPRAESSGVFHFRVSSLGRLSSSFCMSRNASRLQPLNSWSHRAFPRGCYLGRPDQTSGSAK